MVTVYALRNALERLGSHLLSSLPSLTKGFMTKELWPMRNAFSVLVGFGFPINPDAFLDGTATHSRCAVS